MFARNDIWAVDEWDLFDLLHLVYCECEGPFLNYKIVPLCQYSLLLFTSK